MFASFFRKFMPNRQQNQQVEEVAENLPPPRVDKFPKQQEYDKYLKDKEFGDYYWDDDDFYGRFLNDRLLYKSDELLPLQNQQRTAVELFAYFMGGEATGIVYNPVGMVNCMTRSYNFQLLLEKYGIAAIQEHIGAGEQRVVINCPHPIDPNWAENTTRMNGALLAGVRHFANHYYVVSGGTLYDPTGGYQGAANNFSAILEPVNGHAGYYTVVGQPAFLHGAAFARLVGDVLTLFTDQPIEIAQ